MHPFGFRSLTAGAALAYALGAAPAVYAQATYSFNLPEQALGRSLRAIASRTGSNIVFDPASVRGRAAPALNGAFSAEQAVERVLTGSGLAARQTSGGSWVIVQSGDTTSGEIAAIESSTVEEEQIVVTGSRLSRRFEDIAPVQRITARDLERTGITSLSDAVRQLPASNGVLNGSFQNGDQNTGGAVGAVGADLRGLGPSATLVLLNGRRLVSYGYAGGTGSAFVDLNNLPFEAIDRIEVLTSGASAIYGSDALAGVINIVLESNFQGLELQAESGISSRGDAARRRFSITGGFGSLDTDGYNILLNASHRTEDGLFYAQRPRTRTADLTRFGLGDLRLVASPSVDVFADDDATVFLGTLFPCPTATQRADGACVFDQFGVTNAYPDQTSTSLFAQGSVRFGDFATFYTELGYARNETETQYAPSVTLFLPLPSRQFFEGVFPVTFDFPGSDATPIANGRYLASDFGNRTLSVRSQNYRAVGGLRGTLGGFSWNVSGIWNRGDADQRYENNIRLIELINAVLGFDPPPFVLGAPVTDAERDRLAAPFENHSRATLLSGEAGITGPVFTLPSGDVEIALGAEIRRETIALDSAIGLELGVVDLVVIQDVVDARDTYSAYAELGIPLLPGLDVQLATRFSSYSRAAQATRDPGSAWTFKAATRYEIAPWLALRASYEQGFRAPSLFETSLETIGTVNITATDPLRCPVTGAERDCLTVPGIVGANPDLEPEKSNSLNLGFVLRPLTDLTLTVDAFRIERRNEIAEPDFAFLFANEAAFPDRIQRGPPDRPGLPGPVTLFDVRLLNISRSLVRGFDLSLHYAREVAGFGRLRGAVEATYLDKSTDAAFAGATPISLAGFRGTPRSRANASIGVDRGPFSTTLSLFYTGGFRLAANDQVPCRFAATRPDACTIAAYPTMNWTASYRFRDGLTLGFAINNLFDRQAPLVVDNGAVTSTSLYDVLGRYFRANATLRF